MTDIGYGPTLVFRDPDNIQLEFYVHPGAGEVAQCFTEAESPDAKRLIEATANPRRNRRTRISRAGSALHPQRNAARQLLTSST
jgi:hypothetical protein